MNADEPAATPDSRAPRCQYNELLEAIRESEARLLQVFYGFTALNDKSIAEEDTNIAVLINRILEARLLEVEKRFNMPPAA